MLLVADSGSTKTDWKLIEKGVVKALYETIGFNPYIIPSDAVLEELNKSALKAISTEVEEVHLYAAGCSTKANQELLQKPLAQFFINAKVNVNHDLMAAARATCGNNEGMVAILGTGSNSCLYNGTEVIENVRALGYVLGDYGSGADIGKAFLQKVFAKEFNESLQHKFDSQIELNEVLDAVYKKPLPNRYLASFNEMVAENISEKEVEELVKSRLRLFFEYNVCKYSNYKNYPLHIVGSIGVVYKHIIEAIAKEYSLNLGEVIQKPIDNLVSYHLNKINL